MLCFLKAGFVLFVLPLLIGREPAGLLIVSYTLGSKSLATGQANSVGGSLLLLRGHGVMIQE